MQEILCSQDPEVIRRWAGECLAAGLYREDGVARSIFADGMPISLMAYLPGVGWSMYAAHRTGGRPWQHTFVRPDMRRQGIGTRLWRLARDRYTCHAGSST